MLQSRLKTLKEKLSEKRTEHRRLRDRHRHLANKYTRVFNSLIAAADTPSLLTAAARALESKKGEGEAVFFSTFLKNIARNDDRNPKGRRYEKAVKDFALHVLHWGGGRVYDFLQANMEGFPDRKTAERHGKTVFLTSPGLNTQTVDFIVNFYGKGTLVHLEEDATRMKAIMEAHDRKGQLFGFVNTAGQPLDPPVPIVSSWEELQKEDKEGTLGNPFWESADFIMSFKNVNHEDFNMKFQDPLHLLLKICNTLLSKKHAGLLGERGWIDAAYLRALAASRELKEAKLREAQLDPTSDRQNMQGGRQATHPEVLEKLWKNAESRPTALLLEIGHLMDAAFTDEALMLKQRIENLSYAVWLSRVWKLWISKCSEETLNKAFLTRNVELCIEIDFHSFIALIRFLREKVPHLEFKP
uniref:Uncharacterized protein n=1 Tax=Chromera velia CCMP2878 TaxID=1169474 RepID=A0A0G4FUQ1_9ALVE|eukprot:Cvel_18802.t1-p1 / transcript=Cvel_18802.t1 / gene=Cvel_18802 / organism=Chromera_velia_CCMP2878 / gene_product=hypothetical protein / transcript_product=hypothetical protein / location=Cvel_scaffold1579:7718-9575(-) / protein_length=413 / sequence_SO=supercontig / SO=protein_coding / is_pseudo=false